VAIIKVLVKKSGTLNSNINSGRSVDDLIAVVWKEAFTVK
jgi:hypothetical protein